MLNTYIIIIKKIQQETIVKAEAIELKSIVTCPYCGNQKEEIMQRMHVSFFMNAQTVRQC